MNLKHIARATAKVLASYLTYQAMRVVVEQLNESNPPQAFWLAGFSSSGKLQDGDAYLQELLLANRELAFRIMTVREHIVENLADLLPEMALTTVRESNTRLRCEHLERMVNVGLGEAAIPLAEALDGGESEVAGSDSGDRAERPE